MREMTQQNMCPRILLGGTIGSGRRSWVFTDLSSVSAYASMPSVLVLWVKHIAVHVSNKYRQTFTFPWATLSLNQNTACPKPQQGIASIASTD